MLKYRMRLIMLAVTAALTACSTASADIWRLAQDHDWKTLSPHGSDKFLLDVANAKKLVNTGQTKAAQKAYDNLKNDFPDIAGPDLNAFIEAEIFYSQGKFTKAYRNYEKLLRDYPQSKLRHAALDRQFAIGTAYLGGRKKQVLRVIKLKGDDEGVRIMEKITDHAGIDSPLGLKAALAVVENYQKRELFNEAYLKWWEISLQWKRGQIAKEALLNMARAKHALYNKHPQQKRPFYDAANLSTARTYYLQFKSRYPKDAREIAVDQTIKQIDEQLAQKQFAIGRYYHKTGHILSANLYYDLVIESWPGTKAAEAAMKLRSRNIDSQENAK